ncbi:hypothetical protein [Viridibacillus arvi]|uniref:hypothetical protein n=1 Tax=Viridibacillus arvi TaxID=263475 RepID=UPI0034CE02AF
MPNDFITVMYLGIVAIQRNEIEFLIQTEEQDVRSCKTKCKSPARKSFLESLNIGVPIQILADFKNREKNVLVEAFII